MTGGGFVVGSGAEPRYDGARLAARGIVVVSLTGRPITAARLGQRLRLLGIYAMTGRRAALTDLAARMPAAVLADLLHLGPGTAVHWMREAGADWNRYAADLARTRAITSTGNSLRPPGFG